MAGLKLSNIINSLSEKNIKNFISELRQSAKNFSYKDEPESNRLALYLNYTENTNDLNETEREMRSVILERNTLNIISYSMNELYTDDDSLLELVKNKENKFNVYECIEGTLLSVYYYNDKWNVSTRRCLDAKNSLWLSKKSHYDMMLECVQPNFFEVLNKDYNYYFVLQHYENKGVIDYSKRYGVNYKNLVLLCIRNKHTHLEEQLDNTLLLNVGVKLPNEYNDLSLLEQESNLENIFEEVQYEGLLVKIYDENCIKYLRLPTNRYKKKSSLMPNSQNKYVSYLKLYQMGTLKEHIGLFPESGKIVHPTKSYMVFDTIGVVDSCIQVLVKELYNLFKLMYDLKYGEQKNKNLYELLPASYHDILYAIKGLFYKKRIEQKTDPTKNHKLTERDIYVLLKTYTINQLVFLLRGRKMLRDAIIKNKNVDKRYNDLDKLSSLCEFKKLMLSSVYLTLLFDK
jgi:hypothetical protein